MLDVDRLVVLRAVAAHGSMAGAARQLGYTRSAISQQMSALERSAGATLLIRTNNRMSLTPIAWRLVEHTERILIELRAAAATLDQDSDELTGALKVGIPFGEGPAIMGPALTGVRQNTRSSTSRWLRPPNERCPPTYATVDWMLRSCPSSAPSRQPRSWASTAGCWATTRCGCVFLPTIHSRTRRNARWRISSMLHG